MSRYLLILILILILSIYSCNQNKSETTHKAKSDSLKISGEKHLRNIKMLTFEGENAEAYFSFSDDQLIFQSTHGDLECDQIFTMDLNGQNKKMVSTGKGRTTCSYFLPGDKKIIYASTHGAYSDCPPKPDFSHGYVWKVYKEFDLYKANADGSNPEVFLSADGYDAEATISPKGDKIVFTSTRNGDLDIYSVNLDGSDLKQLTTKLGYDGGPFYSWDGSKIVYRSYHPKSDEEIKRYRDLLKQELIEPSNFQIMVMNADGSDHRQVTHNEYANFAPFYHPDDKRIIFCSNLNSKNPRNPDFNLWMINEDGSGLEQITFFDGFDGFPMFTHDGKKLVFDSNRFNRQPRDTNVFLADWVN
jgi:TolB protein